MGRVVCCGYAMGTCTPTQQSAKYMPCTGIPALWEEYQLHNNTRSMGGVPAAQQYPLYGRNTSCTTIPALWEEYQLHNNTRSMGGVPAALRGIKMYAQQLVTNTDRDLTSLKQATTQHDTKMKIATLNVQWSDRALQDFVLWRLLCIA